MTTPTDGPPHWAALTDCTCPASVLTLPWSRDLASAIERLGNFLVSYRQ